jgi:hypothetical protein
VTNESIEDEEEVSHFEGTDDDESFRSQQEYTDEISQSSEGDLESLNTSNSSHVQHTSASFNLRLPWKHEPVVLELLQYYTDQVCGLFFFSFCKPRD